MLIASTSFAAGPAGQDWPRYRGPDGNGCTCGNGILDREPLGLELIWKRPLGSGYSGVVVAQGYGVTMYTDGTDDLLTAFVPELGKELWRYRIAKMHPGHTGSDDGPTSTPTIADGIVYGLGPYGHLFAVRLADGSELWSRSLDGTNSRPPKYGFTTTPLVAGDLVIVQTGGSDGHAITAFDQATGEPRWSLGADTVQYQSPTLLEIGGRRQIVATTDRYLMGIGLEKGELLWRRGHKLLDYEAFDMPQLLAKDRLLVTSTKEIASLRLTDQGSAGVELREQWRLTNHGECFSLPVCHQGYIYNGVSRHFLICADAGTGEVKWRSRSAGGEGLIMVDGNLVVLSPRGELVIIEASPDAYREKARLPVFERGGLTTPTFAGGRFYLRNLSELAAVAVTSTPHNLQEQGRELLGEFGDFVLQTEAADDPVQLVKERLASQKSFPIIEGQDLVHFIYEGQAQDVAVTGNFLPFTEERGLDRIAGTDVFFKSIRLDPEAVWDYQLLVDGQLIADPKNPHGILTLGGPGSILRLPLSTAPLEIDDLEEQHRGRLVSYQLRSKLRNNERPIRIYLPNEYESVPDTRYPVLFVTYGLDALSAGYMNRWLDRLIFKGRIAPLIAVFFQEEEFTEFSGPFAEDLLRLLTEELIPYVDEHYRTIPDPDSRAVLGILDGGEFAIWGAFKAPGFYSKIALQSLVFLQAPAIDELPSLIKSVEKQPLELYFELRRNCLKGEGIDYEGNTLKLIGLLEEAGYKVEKRQVPGSWGWSSWRAQYEELLPRLFPPQSVER
jgi:enterochelin esterase-like enzyme/outer membrane protein assembly factor BamB